jgi:hypothetical protein
VCWQGCHPEGLLHCDSLSKLTCRGLQHSDQCVLDCSSMGAVVRDVMMRAGRALRLPFGCDHCCAHSLTTRTRKCGCPPSPPPFLLLLLPVPADLPVQQHRLVLIIHALPQESTGRYPGKPSSMVQCVSTYQQLCACAIKITKPCSV